MTDNSSPPVGRRGFLKVSGAVLGGIAATGTVVATESTDRYIVKTSDVGALDLEVVHDLSEVGYAVVRASEAAVESDDDVTSFAPDTAYELSLPTDRVDLDGSSAVDEPYYGLQWDKQSQNIPEVHETTRGEGSRVAIIDTGVDAGHPDLAHAVNTDLSRNFTDDDYGSGGPYGGYHGTHVGGIVAADDRNEAGVVGSAPGAELVDCRVFSPSASATFGDIIAAMVYAAAVDCDAANLSIGAYPISRRGIGSFYGGVLNKVCAYGRRKGTVYVVAAGNDAADLQHDGSYVSLPNEAENVLSISATGPIGFEWGSEGLEEPFWAPARYTNYGTNAIDLGAPGGNYDPAFPAGWYHDLVFNAVSDPVYDDDGTFLGVDRGYGWAAGTSMAAPQVAGAVALVTSVAPDANANEVCAHLRNAASVPEGYDKTYYGNGYLDTLGATEAAK